MKIPEGFGLVTPKSSANAALLLEAAQNIGVDVSLIRTTSDGYHAPTAVIDEYNRLVHDLPVAETTDENGDAVPAEDLVHTDEPADGTINAATLDGSNLAGGVEPTEDDEDEEAEGDPADQNAAASVNASTPTPAEDTTAEKQAIDGAEQAGAGSQTPPTAPADGDNTGDEGEDDEVTLPDAKANTHEEIDAFAADHGITYDGIEAKNAEKPTRAEKVAHIASALENKGD